MRPVAWGSSRPLWDGPSIDCRAPAANEADGNC
jgi:hypothetical protein